MCPWARCGCGLAVRPAVVLLTPPQCRSSSSDAGTSKTAGVQLCSETKDAPKTSRTFYFRSSGGNSLCFLTQSDKTARNAQFHGRESLPANLTVFLHRLGDPTSHVPYLLPFRVECGAPPPPESCLPRRPEYPRLRAQWPSARSSPCGRPQPLRQKW